MFANPHMTFVMPSLCYAQHLGYWLSIMFPSLSILQHYVEFNICALVTLEKLLGARSFGGFIGHLATHQAILFVSLGEFGFPFIV
jgi:hypothetical protein